MLRDYDQRLLEHRRDRLLGVTPFSIGQSAQEIPVHQTNGAKIHPRKSKHQGNKR